MNHPLMGSFRRGEVSIDEAISGLLRDRVVHPLLGIKGSRDMPRARLSRGKASREFAFSVGGVPLCGDRVVRAHEMRDGKTILVGEVPSFEPAEPKDARDWPALGEAESVVMDLLSEKGFGEYVAASWRVPSAKRCVEPTADGQREAWELVVTAGGWNWRAIADDREVYLLEKRWFGVTGRVYEENEKDDATALVTLDQTTSPLTNARVRVSGSGYDASDFTGSSYDYSMSDKRFEMTTSFYHADRHIDYLIARGFDWDTKAITVKLFDSTFNKSPDNAMYQPPSSSSGTPIIYVGNGSGTVLANLTTDSDVVSHEIGHHIIYQTLTKISGESLVVHEGLSDFFTNARSGDPCLAESICVETTARACMIKNQCLRTADQTFKLSTDGIKDDEHLKGQVVSGLMWDLRGDTYGVPTDTLMDITMEAVSLLGPSSGYHDLIQLLVWADKEVADGAYGCDITTAAKARGFPMTGIDCKNPSTAITGTKESTSGSSKSSSSTDGGWLCGTIGGVSPNSNRGAAQAVLLMSLLALPVFASLRRARGVY
jgi:hypothetical protein